MEVVNVLPNGNAPSGLSVGDMVRTGGGNYQIVAPGTAGASYNPESGYWSMKSGDIPYYVGQYQEALSNAARNSALSQTYAREQMAFQTAANAKAMSFSAEEAEKNRQWQEQMSNSAHQREVLDLVRAGLNPVLSVNSGASTPSGASAAGVTSSGAQGSVDMSTNSVVGALVSSVLSRDTNLEIAKMQNETNRFLGLLQNETARYNANVSAQAVLGAASLSSEASKYASDITYQIHENFPTTTVGAGASLLTKAANWIEDRLSRSGSSSAKTNESTYNGLNSLISGVKSVLATDPDVKEGYKRFTHAYD